MRRIFAAAIVLAVLVGLVVTVSPAALLLVSR